MEVLSNARVDHLGLVAGFAKEMKLAERIDKLLGVYPDEKVTVGESVVAMILNGLGFTDRPLSLVSQFFENVPISMLFREGLSAEDFNRFKLSRALDRIAAYGCEALFGQIALGVAKDFELQHDIIHFDTTSFSLTGDHLSDSDESTISVTKGYSKDHRPDLKQIVQELGCSSDEGVPLFMKMWDGNESDNKIFQARAKELIKQLSDPYSVKAVVADSKFYSASNAENMVLLPFITRVPETIGAVRNLIEKALSDPDEWLAHSESRDYKAYDVEDLGIKQKWVVVFSKAAEARSDTSLNKKVKRERDKIEKALFHFRAQRFNCVPDAEKALSKLVREWDFHTMTDHKVEEHRKYAGRGRPKPGAEPTAVEYQIIVSFEQNTQKISREKLMGQCYVLASHGELVDLSVTEIISAYSDQQNVERGFRFLKDPFFFTSSLFVKNPRRIEALVTVMTFALLLYSYAQRRLRRQLADKGEALPNQIKKLTQTPTLRWIFQVLQGVSCLTIKTNEGLQTIRTGLSELRVKILKLFSQQVCQIYQLSSA
jgi:transposase